MRLTLLAILVLSSAAASARAAEDRYGPPRAHPMQLASTGVGYQGRMLTWSSRPFTPQAPEPAAAPAQPQPPPAPAPAPLASREAPAAPPRPMAAAPQPAPAPRAMAAAPARAALPDSLYAPPPPAAAPQRMAQAAPPATAPTEGSHVRFYSVHRQYGLAPDAIPEPPANGSNYVLIGVPNDGGKSAPADGDDDADADGKPF